MKTKSAKKLFLIVLFFCLSFSPAHSEKIYKIGYLEGGSYWIFDKTMAALNSSLQEKGWRAKIFYPEDAKLSPGWENPYELPVQAKILMHRKDLDLIVTAGTDATAAILKVNNGRIPILAMGVSDAVGSGFVADKKDSGIENFTVRIVPDRFERMFMIFHEVVRFKNLGLIYPDSESGKKYTNLDAAKKISQERNFKITEYKLKNESSKDCFAALKELSKQKIDAFFIPSLLCFDLEKNNLQPMMKFLREKKIPTFARNGSAYVRSGALMGFSTLDFTKRGDFISDQVIRILKGVKPRDLNMIDHAVPKISFNLKVAEEINFDPPFDILSATDEIYKKIIIPEKN